MRKLAKKVGKNHELAAELWESENYDAKVISLLIDDPNKMTEEQMERQVEDLNAGHLAHVFSSCGAPLAKAPFVKDLAEKWILSDDKVRRKCGYGLLHEMTKWKNKKALGDDYLAGYIEHIKNTIDGQDPDIQLAMGHALMGIGIRNRELHAPALELAKQIGPIDFDPNGSCKPYDVVKHLTSNYVKEKLGV